MPKNKIRATITFNSQRLPSTRIEVGYYDTQAQATAAKNAARQALDKWEELNPVEPPKKKKLPSVPIRCHTLGKITKIMFRLFTWTKTGMTLALL